MLSLCLTLAMANKLNNLTRYYSSSIICIFMHELKFLSRKHYSEFFKATNYPIILDYSRLPIIPRYFFFTSKHF